MFFFLGITIAICALNLNGDLFFFSHIFSAKLGTENSFNQNKLKDKSLKESFWG